MRVSSWPKTPILLTLFLVLPISITAQWQKKPYSKWSEKEALSVLNDSPWGQTQTVTETSRMFDTGRRVDSSQNREAEIPQIKFRIRFFSAKPIRQAISRIIELKQKGELNPQLAGQLRALAAGEFPDYIVITVITEVADSGSLTASAASLLDRQTTALLKNETYLLVNGGQRVFLQEYQAPRKDGLGARFIFPRMVNGKPFIVPESGEVLFNADLSGGPALKMRFKIKDMMFEEKLEY